MLAQRRQTWLNVIGIALGVALVVAVDLANQSAAKAFALSLASLSGQTSHQLVANGASIDEQLFVQLRTEQAIAKSAPRLQAKVKLGDESFTLLGVDPISELSLRRHAYLLPSSILNRQERNPQERNRQEEDRQSFNLQTWPQLLQQSNAVMLLQQTAERLGLAVGDEFEIHYLGRPLTVLLGGVLQPGIQQQQRAALGKLIFTDLANAQHLLRRTGQLDFIDLQLSEQQAQRIDAWLPAAYRLLETQTRNHGLLAMSQAFNTNLTAMSLLALLVAALLIYNSVRFSALRRQAMLGTYRALGVSRRELLQLLLSETLVLAGLASVVGLLLGVLLSQYLLQLVTRTIDDLYFSVTVGQFFLSPPSLLKGFALGLSVSLLATLAPAIAASRTPAITLQRRSETEQRWQRGFRRLSRIGLIGLGLGYLCSLIPSHSLVAGFASLGIMVVGFCCLLPAALNGSCLWLEKLSLSMAGKLGWPPLSTGSRLALRGLRAGLSRTGLAVAALSAALATVMGVSIMISSFRLSVDDWLTQSLRGDLYISIPGSSQRNDGAGITPELLASLRSLEGVERVHSLRSFRSETDAGRLRTVSISPLDKQTALLQQLDRAQQRYARGEGIFISEPLAYHRALKVGDTLRVYTPFGPQRFTVLGIFRDYSSSRGVISVPAQLLLKHWRPIPVNGVFIELRPGAAAEPLLQRIRQLLADDPQHFRIGASEDIRDNVLAIFDRTFAITQVLRLLVLVVAFTGLLSALLALQLEKAREYAILRATGMGLSQLSWLMLQQTGLLGVFSALFALPLGYLLADRLIHVINRRAFGWSMELSLPLDIIPQGFALALGASLLAAVYPLWILRRQSIASSLREE